MARRASIKARPMSLYEAAESGASSRSWRPRTQAHVTSLATSVAISGDTVVVGAPLDDGRRRRGSRLGLCLCAKRRSLEPTAEAGGLGRGIADLFGQAVAISGDTSWSARLCDGAGRASIKARPMSLCEAAEPSQQQKLEASDPAAFDNFAFQSVAISGDTVVVGAWVDDGAADTDQGSAYVFVRSGGVWSQQQKLEARTRRQVTCSASRWRSAGRRSVGARVDDGWRAPIKARPMSLCEAAESGASSRSWRPRTRGR